MRISEQNYKRKQDIHMAKLLISYCGGFSLCSQILWYFSDQKVELSSPSSEYRLDLVTF